MRKISWLVIFVLVLLVASYFVLHQKAIAPILPLEQLEEMDNNQNIQVNQPATSTPIKVSEVLEPISGALARITKKPFGIHITPQNSPVQPEKFSGYHTGTDFETTEAEQNVDVPIYAICAGKLLLKKQATGYGGVAVQSCEINKQVVTVVYGHLKLASVTVKINQELKVGEKIGFLGKGFSAETDGERKHLHLGIHTGQQVVLLGYVPQQSQLTAWLDASTLFVK